MNKIENLEPKAVFSIFQSISRIPRPSKKEQQISDWLMQFAKDRNIQAIRDNALNVIMCVPATPGFENREGIILQAHMDMVCEKENTCNHNFDTDPIDVYIEGDFLRAHGTTLGADDGIGMAMALAALTSPHLPHPALEALFTVDEETGLTGANQLQPNLLHYKRLINLDSEDDGQVFIGCAGGIDTTGRLFYKPEPINPQQWYAATISLSGLTGGHSGDDINKGRANANKLLTRLLYRILHKMPTKLVNFSGGNLRNAIPREAQSTILIPPDQKEKLRIELNNFIAIVESEYKTTEPNMHWDMQTCPTPQYAIPDNNSLQLIKTLYACPHGVIAMSKEISGLVETSTNLASVKMLENTPNPYFEITTSQRSSIESKKEEIKETVACALSLTCQEIEHSDGYPGWQPNTTSPLLNIAKETYRELFNKIPEVKAIHAGLECGLFLEKYPHLDMISIGPQMYFVHSPQEKLSISSTKNCWEWLCRILSK